MVADTDESKAEPLSAVKPSNEPEAEPEEIVGSKVATKFPEVVCVTVLQAETSPVATYVPVIAGINLSGSPGIEVLGLYVPV
jgi:hypothetical protein